MDSDWTGEIITQASSSDNCLSVRNRLLLSDGGATPLPLSAHSSPSSHCTFLVLAAEPKMMELAICPGGGGEKKAVTVMELLSDFAESTK